MNIISLFKKLSPVTLSLVLLATMIAPNLAKAQPLTPVDLNGYGWSETIGWISFNCKTGSSSGGNICGTSNYKVTLNPGGGITGWAWSENIGWIKFGGLSNFPTGGGTASTNARVTGTYPNMTFSGWARACAGTSGGNCATMTNNPLSGGWDGWISLGGTGYSVKTNSAGMVANSYAWGSDVVGWIDMFSNLSLDNSSATISGSGCTISKGSGTCNGTFSWNFTNATSPNIYNLSTGATYSNLPSATNVSHPIKFGPNIVQARNNSLVLGAITITGSCEAGTVYNAGSNTCELAVGAPPTIDISIKPSDFVRYGSMANIDIQISGLTDGSCTLTGNGVNQTGITASTVITSPELRAKSIFTLTCAGSYGVVSDSATVEIIPSAQEI